MSVYEASLDQTIDLIAKGISSTLAESLEAKFHESVDPMIKELALDYAKRITAKVESYREYDNNSVQVKVFFNKEEITTKEIS